MQRPSGILLAGIIAGVFNSSTRAELAGLISALAKPIALHIALDNESVANRARAIAEGSYTHRKPWRLRPDGDLWAIVASLLQARGHETTKISWTKGHAGWQWIAEQSDNATTVANGQADLAAGKGEAVTGTEGESTALDYHARKLKAYAGLVARIQVHAAKLICEDKRRREEMGIENEGKTQPTRFIESPEQPSRHCFTSGIPLAFMSLPPGMALHDSNNSDMFSDPNGLHIFWTATRWRSDPQARPTTWLEIFALFRLWGGGPREFDPNMPRPPLLPSIKAFIKASKALFKIIAEGGALEMLRPAKGKTFLLATYGLEVHLPAVQAELCLSTGQAKTIHDMLTRIRLVKQGASKGKLRASAAPLPKKEPWFDMLIPGPTPIPTIMNSRRLNMLNNIEIRGERGDFRELKPHSFSLSCPSCGSFKECARVRLFTTTAKGLTCSICRKSTSSTRWHCLHNVPWTKCSLHREPGFRCGARSLPTLERPKVRIGLGHVTLKALKHKQARLSKLGSLGEPKSHPLSISNLVGLHSSKRTLVQKKIGKRRGRRPGPVRAGVGNQLSMPNITPTKALENSKDCSIPNDLKRHATTSKYWLAHLRQPGVSTSSNNDRLNHPSTYETGSLGGPYRPAKIARLYEPFSKQAKACKGNCPLSWTIESFCELCHSV